MMDILESLRRDAKVTQNAQYRRAADEIERLRAERDALKAELRDRDRLKIESFYDREEIARLRAENRTLLGFLAEAADFIASTTHDIDEDDCLVCKKVGYLRAVIAARCSTRQAL